MKEQGACIKKHGNRLVIEKDGNLWKGAGEQTECI